MRTESEGWRKMLRMMIDAILTIWTVNAKIEAQLAESESPEGGPMIGGCSFGWSSVVKRRRVVVLGGCQYPSSLEGLFSRPTYPK